MHDVNGFLELFAVQPGYKILDITAHADALTAGLARSLEPVQGRLSLVLYPGVHAEVTAGKRTERQEIDSFEKPFRALPRDNDIVFIRNVLHRHRYPERLLRAIYTTLANAAEVVIVTDKADADTEMQLALLEKIDFRAGNVIEELTEGATVVTARKMHMWGNGL